MSSVTWKDYANSALELVGQPVAHMGRDPSMGFDCVGIPHYAARMAGLDMGPTIHYAYDPSEQDLVRGLEQFADRCADNRQAHIWQVWIPGGSRHVAVPAYDIDGGRIVCVIACRKRGRVWQVALRPDRCIGWMVRGIDPRPEEVLR